MDCYGVQELLKVLHQPLMAVRDSVSHFCAENSLTLLWSIQVIIYHQSLAFLPNFLMKRESNPYLILWCRGRWTDAPEYLWFSIICVRNRISLLKKFYPYVDSHPFLMRLFLFRMVEDIINGMTSLKTKLGAIRKEEGMQARHNRMWINQTRGK